MSIPDLTGARFVLLKNNNKDLVVALYEDGKVLFGDNLEPEEAAIQFWDAISRLSKLGNNDGQAIKNDSEP